MEMIRPRNVCQVGDMLLKAPNDVVDALPLDHERVNVLLNSLLNVFADSFVGVYEHHLVLAQGVVYYYTRKNLTSKDLREVL